MTWHRVIAAVDEFGGLLDKIRAAGGIITGSGPCAAGFLVTYVTFGTEPDGLPVLAPNRRSKLPPRGDRRSTHLRSTPIA